MRWLPRPLWLQVSVMCVSALPPADHERTNRPTRNLFTEQRPPTRPESCTTGCFALSLLLRPTTTTGEMHHRVLRATASPDTSTTIRPPRRGHRIPRDERGRRPPGPREGIWAEEIWGLSFFLSFSFSSF